MRDDPTYAQRFAEAERKAARRLEDEAVRRAVEGVRKPVLYKGKPVYVNGVQQWESEYSDSLLTTLLKANNPDKFKDRTEVSLNWVEQYKKAMTDPASLDDKTLKELTEFELQRTFKGDQAKIEEFRRKTMGEPVVIEATAEAEEKKEE